MAQKTQTNVLRGRGRPKKSAPDVAPSPVANAPAKRGRVGAADVVVEPPKKRGRPSKVQAEEQIVVEEAPAPEAEVEAPAPTPKKRGRPSKANAIAAEEPVAATKRRGRPPKNATVDLGRVANSPRVSKRQIPVKASQASPLNPRLPSKPRSRPAPAQKVVQKAAPQPAKRRGRPPKAAAALAPAPKKVAVSKPTAPRKKRGYTMVDVPDKFAVQVQQYLQELQDAKPLPTPVVDGAMEQVPDEAAAEEEAEAGAEEGTEPILIEEVEVPTSATADHDDATAMTEQASSVQDDEVNDEDVEDVAMSEHIEEPTEVDISIQEVVHHQQSNEVTTPELEEMEEDTEIQDDDLSALVEDVVDVAEDEIHAFIDSRASGSIFD
jgi:hypothetical protein